MSEFLRVHVAQMNSVDSVEKNVSQILQLLAPLQRTEEAEDQLVCFPENALYFRIREGDWLPALSLADSFWQSLCERARALNAYFHFGSVPLRGKTKLTNTSVLIDPRGTLEATYSKMHLFDIDVEGHRPVRESDVFERGHEPRVLQIGEWSLGQSICYDLRFAELYQWYARRQVDVLLVPSAFLVPTGKAHWEVLLRARAIEGQSYVLAAAQAGAHRAADGSGHERHTFGHSLIVDPWGKILCDAGATEVGLSTLKLSRAEIEKVRRQIPMRNHRHSDF